MRSDKVCEYLKEACDGRRDLRIASNIQPFYRCKELAYLIQDDQEKNNRLEVSDTIKNLILFIVDQVNCEVKKRPEFEMVPPGIEVVRRFECFPSRPIIRRQVRYEKDVQNNTQIQRRYNTLEQRMEAKKEVEYKEFAESSIKCKNDHSAKKAVTPGKGNL